MVLTRTQKKQLALRKKDTDTLRRVFGGDAKITIKTAGSTDSPTTMSLAERQKEIDTALQTNDPNVLRGPSVQQSKDVARINSDKFITDSRGNVVLVGGLPSTRLLGDLTKTKLINLTQSQKKQFGLENFRLDQRGPRREFFRDEDVVVQPIEVLDVVKPTEVEKIIKEFRRNGDFKSVNKIRSLKNAGRLDEGIIDGFKKKLVKQDKAIAKVMKINEKLERWNKNYDNFINPLLNKIFPKTVKVASQTKGGVETFKEVPNTFGSQVARYVVREGSKFLNPFILGTEVAGGLESFRVLKNAGITDLPRASKTVVRTLTNPTFYKENFNPTTVNGLGNIVIAMTMIGLPKKLIGTVTKNGGAILRTGSKGSKAFVKELKLVTKQLLLDKSAKLKGGKRVKAKPSKVELRKRNLARQVNQLTLQQKKGFSRTKGELKLARQEAKIDLQRQKGVGKPLISITIDKPVGKGKKKVSFNKAKPVVKQDVNRIVVLDNKGNIALDIRKKFGGVSSKGFVKPVKNIVEKSHGGVGGQVVKTIVKQSKRQKRALKLAKKLGKKLNRKQKRQLEAVERSVNKKPKTRKQVDREIGDRLEKVLVGESKPSATYVYDEAFNVSPNGWRSSSIKNKVIDSLNKSLNSLNKQRVVLAKKSALRIKRSRIAKEVWKNERRVSAEAIKIFNQLKNPKLDITKVLKGLADVRLAFLIDDTLKALSFIRFSFDNLNDLKRSVMIIGVSKPITDKILDLIDKGVISPKKAVSSVSGRVSKVSKVTKPVSPKKPVRTLKSRIRRTTKAKERKPRRFFPFFKLGDEDKLGRGERFAFNLRVRRAGKVRVLDVRLPLNKALKRLIRVLDNSIARSGDLILVDKTRQKDITKPSLEGFRLRKSKNSGVLRLVEVSKKALSTRREKAQLKRSRRK